MNKEIFVFDQFKFTRELEKRFEPEINKEIFVFDQFKLTRELEKRFEPEINKEIFVFDQPMSFTQGRILPASAKPATIRSSDPIIYLLPKSGDFYHITFTYA
jgi:hypothetical protein